jgi:hypothetical protein
MTVAAPPVVTTPFHTLTWHLSLPPSNRGPVCSVQVVTAVPVGVPSPASV